MFIKLETSES